MLQHNEHELQHLSKKGASRRAAESLMVRLSVQTVDKLCQLQMVTFSITLSKTYTRSRVVLQGMLGNVPASFIYILYLEKTVKKKRSERVEHINPLPR